MDKELFAVRNIRLCTKDCLCLYVCLTGATDTENSIIDKDKCTGCGVCAASCPSGAISMAPYAMPPQQEHRADVVDAMNAVLRSKAHQEAIAAELPGVMGAALEKSARVQAEDVIREAGFMLPQSEHVAEVLTGLTENPPAGLPRDSVEMLLDLLFAQ